MLKTPVLGYPGEISVSGAPTCHSLTQSPVYIFRPEALLRLQVVLWSASGVSLLMVMLESCRVPGSMLVPLYHPPPMFLVMGRTYTLLCV